MKNYSFNSSCLFLMLIIFLCSASSSFTFKAFNLNSFSASSPFLLFADSPKKSPLARVKNGLPILFFSLLKRYLPLPVCIMFNIPFSRFCQKDKNQSSPILSLYQSAIYILTCVFKNISLILANFIWELLIFSTESFKLPSFIIFVVEDCSDVTTLLCTFSSINSVLMLSSLQWWRDIALAFSRDFLARSDILYRKKLNKHIQLLVLVFYF